MHKKNQGNFAKSAFFPRLSLGELRASALAFVLAEKEFGERGNRMAEVDIFSTETLDNDGLAAVPHEDQGGPAFFEENMRRVTELSNAPNDPKTPYKTMYEVGLDAML